MKTKTSPGEIALTSRETDVLNYLKEGMLNKEIASLLGISINTVKTINKHIFEKLRVGNRTEAVVIHLKNKGIDI